MALGLTQSLAEMSARDISWGLSRPVPTIFMCRLSRKCGSHNLLEPSGLVQVFTGIALSLSFRRLMYIKSEVLRKVRRTRQMEKIK
jgi:hypothetical protein